MLKDYLLKQLSMDIKNTVLSDLRDKVRILEIKYASASQNDNIEGQVSLIISAVTAVGLILGLAIKGCAAIEDFNSRRRRRSSDVPDTQGTSSFSETLTESYPALPLERLNRKTVRFADELEDRDSSDNSGSSSELSNTDPIL